MRHTLWVIILSVACLGASGCGKTEDTAPVAAAAATPAQPQDVLQQFLSAVKAGQKEVAENLLTTVAREKTAAEGIGIGDLGGGSSAMSFEIQGVQFLQMPDSKEAAHVSCVFSEKQEDNKVETHNIIWALRKETQGWRVAGMAWTPFAGEPPIFMDFENPADMIAKQQLLAEEQERRANPQAVQPATTVAGAPATGTPATIPQNSATMQPNPGLAPMNPGVVQPNPGVVQTNNVTPVNGSPNPLNGIPQQVPNTPQAERFNAPSPLR
jgi:hypothetical protein